MLFLEGKARQWLSNQRQAGRLTPDTDWEVIEEAFLKDFGIEKNIQTYMNVFESLRWEIKETVSPFHSFYSCIKELLERNNCFFSNFPFFLWDRLEQPTTHDCFN